MHLYFSCAPTILFSTNLISLMLNSFCIGFLPSGSSNMTPASAPSGDVQNLFEKLKSKKLFDLVVTSPPYNIGKEYESAKTLDEYFENQKEVIKAIDKHVKDSGSICWQVGNYINKKDGSIFPLDIGFYNIFNDLGYILKNRIIWHFGHGLQATKRLSGRYETVLWFVKSEDYTFNLDPIRIPQKYPGKTYYKGPNKGKIWPS